jgi:hypothetical protein
MIWHIFRKDWSLLWSLPAAVAAVRFALAATLFKLGHFGDDSSAPLLDLLVVMSFLGSAFCIAASVHQDAIPGVRQDWLVRPVARRDLVMAKLLFALLAAQLPILAADLIECLADGFALGQSVAASGSRAFYLLVTFTLPVLALASLTKNLLEFIAGAVAASFGLAVLTVLGGRSPQYNIAASTGVAWPAESLSLALMLVGAVVVLRLQYFRRGTRPAFYVAGTTAALCLLTSLLPWPVAFAVQQRRAPSPGSAGAIAIAFDPGRDPDASGGRVSLGSLDQRGRYTGNVLVSLPLRIYGLPDDAVLKADRSKASLIAPDGSRADLGPADRLEIRNEGHGSAGRRIEHSVIVNGALYDRFRNQSVRLEIEYSLTLFGLTASHALPALDGDQRMPDVGWCQSQVNHSGAGVRMNCLAPGKDPLCVTAFLEHISTGRRNPSRSFGYPNYAPYFGKFMPDAISRFGVDLPFYDPSGLARYQVDSPRLRDSQIVLRVYQPRDHFVRRVVIPAIRFENWEPARGDQVPAPHS